MIWINKHKLHANISRFQQPKVNSKTNPSNSYGGKLNSNPKVNVNSNLPKNQKFKGNESSYVNVVKGTVLQAPKDIDTPALVLEDDCVMTKDLSKCLLGRVKEFASLVNIKKAFISEGFMNIMIRYMGEKWILLEFGDSKSLILFRDNVSISSWFSQISLASMDFVTESRIAWVELEGIPFKLWSEKTFKRIASKWGEMLDTEDQEDDCFHSKRICVQTKCHKWISEEFKIIFRGKVFWIRAKETPGWVPDFTDEEDENEISDTESKDDDLKVDDQVTGIHREEEDVPKTLFEEGEIIKDQSDANNRGDQEIPSEDPFNIYELLNKKDTDANIQETEFSAKYPPGFTPKEDSANNSANCGTAKVENNMETNKDADTNEFCVNQSESNLKEDGAESTFSGYFKKSKGPRSGGSILNLLEDVVKVGHVMGYNMEGYESNMEEIIKSQGAGEVNR
ncbi:nucleotide-binding alpha-beta plait domain-containing protein [Tanacetum coccineum]